MPETTKRRPVKQVVPFTSHISFEEETSTFNIRCGESLYCFCINRDKELMHLYWGPDLPDFDLRYQMQKIRKSHFTTSEVSVILTAPHHEDDVGAYIEEAIKKENTELVDDMILYRNAKDQVSSRKQNVAWRLWQQQKIKIEGFKFENMSNSDTGSSTQKDEGGGGGYSSEEDLVGSKQMDEINIDSAAEDSSETSSLSENAISLDNTVTPTATPALTPDSRKSSKSSRSSPHQLKHLTHQKDSYSDLSAMFLHKQLNRDLVESSDEDDDIVSEKDKDKRIIAAKSVTSTTSTTPTPIVTTLQTDTTKHRSSPMKKSFSTNAFPALLKEAQSTGNESSKTSNDTGHSSRSYDFNAGKLGKGSINNEYSDFGTGDFRNPSFIVRDDYKQGSTISPIKYESHEIFRGKFVPEGEEEGEHIPHIRHPDADERFSTLVVTMVDQISMLRVKIIYVSIHDSNTLVRKVIFRNDDTRPITYASKTNNKIIERANSFTADFDCQNCPFHLLQLSGSWGREREYESTELCQGIQHFGSLRGVSGHQFSPFAAISIGPFNEKFGEVKGFSLIYSGNFLVECELTDLNRLRVNMGINPVGFSWHLDQGCEFHTPEALLSRSSEGVGGLSRELHSVLRKYLIAPCPSWVLESPPVLLNTWEALYFNVTHESVVDLAKSAKAIGVNVLCVDDGWFGQRHDDRSSLGDWIVNKTKFPLGFEGLAEDLNALDIKLGVWFEPEMISEDSLIAKQHPDWILKGFYPGPSQVSRNQYVLDMSRSDIRDYLFDCIAKILSSANIEYLKWDMNRPLTDVFSFRDAKTPGYSSYVDSVGNNKESKFPLEIWQSEVFHRYVLGLYELQNRIVRAFPHVLIENCASGGGRFDPGMLFFSPQIWCSDNTDALARLKIQYGTSIIYPASSIGSHVSSIPNHITGNYTRPRTRGFVAMCGTFGFELDLTSISLGDKQIFRDQAKIFKAVCPIIHNGNLYRLWNPFLCPFAASSYVSADKSSAVVFGFSLNSEHWNRIVPPLYLDGLQEDAVYEVTEIMPNNIIQNPGNLRIVETKVPRYQLGVSHMYIPGSILTNVGLPIKFFTLDDSVMFLLLRCTTGKSKAPTSTSSSSSSCSSSSSSSSPSDHKESSKNQFHGSVICSDSIQAIRMVYQNQGFSYCNQNNECTAL